MRGPEQRVARIAERLRAVRMQRGLKQGSVARALFITRATLSQYERAKRSPSVDALLALCYHYGCSLSEFVTEEDY